MISLIAAFKLCHIKDETVYLQIDGNRDDHALWSEKIRKRLDMQKIEVVGIDTRFEHYGPDFLGMKFTVRGMTEEELRKEELYEMQM